MSRPEIILVGAGGHAHACIDVIEQQGVYRIAGLVGRTHELGERHLGYKVIAVDDDLPMLAGTYGNAIVTVGQIKSPDIRIRLFGQLKQHGFTLPVVISPRAYVSPHATIGEGTIVMHDALVNAGVGVGVNCIVNSKALIEHDARVGDHCHVSTASIVNGGTVINKNTFIGSNAMISHNIEVAEHRIVGGGGLFSARFPDDRVFCRWPLGT